MTLPIRKLPLLVALILVGVGGVWLLHRADNQARDTIRKHHLADIEASLYVAKSTHGTYPPYEAATWCGELNNPKNEAVRTQVEQALRQQNEKYKNLAKPFPVDPLADRRSAEASAKADYFYWKRSPAVFELYSISEAEPTGERNSLDCPNATPAFYDYGTASTWREGAVKLSS